MRRWIVCLLSAALAGGAHVAAAHAPTPVAPAERPAEGEFATDAALRREMQGIRDAVAALGHYEMGHMGSLQAVELAAAIEGHVRTIIAECKLPPDADAALHAIIVPLMQNAAALRQKPQDLSVIPPMRAALVRYDEQFRDP
jgi:hypothetical protein